MIEAQKPSIPPLTGSNAPFASLNRWVFKPGLYLTIALVGFIFEFLVELPFVIALYIASDRKRRRDLF